MWQAVRTMLAVAIGIALGIVIGLLAWRGMWVESCGDVSLPFLT